MKIFMLTQNDIGLICVMISIIIFALAYDRYIMSEEGKNGNKKR